MNTIVIKSMLRSTSKLALILCLTLQAAHAMDAEPVNKESIAKKPTLSVPDPFPGHQSRPIQNTVSVAKIFNPKDTQQDKENKEGACQFNSLLAGLMHTSYGRSKIEALFQSQDADNVYIKFYFSPSEDLKTYDKGYQDVIQYANKTLASLKNSLSSAPTEEEQQQHKNSITEIEEELEQAHNLWAQMLKRHETTVSVPKKFVFREDRGSFPRSNPEWLNLIQQAYMKITKNRFLTSHANGGYSCDEMISSNDRFSSVPFCKLAQGTYENSPPPFKSSGRSFSKGISIFPTY